ncbi:DUF6768 family protein [Pararhodobacter oceanensis]|nr:DUF6768 family protein [Pararhodobacter oceanensis]
MDHFDRMLAKAERNGGLEDDSFHDPGYFALALSVFSGRQGWVAFVLMAVQIALFLAAIWAGWRFYAASEVLAAVKYGISAAVLALMALQIKLALMPVMQANRILLALRQIERRG